MIKMVLQVVQKLVTTFQIEILMMFCCEGALHIPQGLPLPVALTALDTVALLTAFFLANMDGSPSKACFVASGIILVGVPLLGLSLIYSPLATCFLSWQRVAFDLRVTLAIFMMPLVVCPALVRATTLNLLASISAKREPTFLKKPMLKSLQTQSSDQEGQINQITLLTSL